MLVTKLYETAPTCKLYNRSVIQEMFFNLKNQFRFSKHSPSLTTWRAVKHTRAFVVNKEGKKYKPKKTQVSMLVQIR